MRVYVAGPIGAADEGRLARVHAAMAAAAELLAAGLAPFVPHLCHFLDERHPQPYEGWLAYDFVWLYQCEALLRLPGHSPGADREVEAAQMSAIPVFYTVADVIAWARRDR